MLCHCTLLVMNAFYAALEIRSQEDIEQMIQLKTKADALNNLGVSYLGLRQRKKAIKALENQPKVIENRKLPYS